MLKMVKSVKKKKKVKISCFVPNCKNKQFKTGKRQKLQFFQVPDGIEGLFWTKAVRVTHRYEKLIDLLSNTDPTLGLDEQLNKKRKRAKDREYCCEVHFDTNADIERIVKKNGSVEFKLKPGSVPSVKPKQKKILLAFDGTQKDSDEDTEMANNEIISEIVKSEETITGGVVVESNNFQDNPNEAPANGYVSLVNISTLTNKKSNFVAPCEVYYEVSNLNEEQPAINYEPIMPILPLTKALMKRKSPYYMGLQQNHFLHLLLLASQRTQLSDVKVMITLRKLHLNEEFEALGDLFDLDKATTEQYFHESKNTVINLVDILATPASIPNHIDVIVKPTIKIEQTAPIDAAIPLLVEPLTFCNDYTVNGIREDNQDDVEPSSPEPSSSDSSSSYVASEEDPDVLSEEFDSGTSSDDQRSRDKTDECHICGIWCTSERLERHIRTHGNPTNVNRTTCGLCLETFDGQLSVRAHQEDAHKGFAYRCDICGLMLTSMRSIERHVLIKHAQVKAYFCDTCGDGFPLPVHLRDHVRKKHLRIRNHGCHLCDKKYFTKNTLDDHIRAIHTKERKYMCKVTGCGKTFCRQSTYESHKRCHAEEKYECNVCSKQFSFRANLRTHLKNIHGQMNL